MVSGSRRNDALRGRFRTSALQALGPASLHCLEITIIGRAIEALPRRGIERSRGAAGARVVDRHRRHLVEARLIDAKLLERMRHAGALAKIKERSLEAVEAAGNAEPSGEAYDLVFDRGAVEGEHIGHEH